MSSLLVGRGSRTTWDWIRGPDDFPPNGFATPQDAPSRGRTPSHGSARFEAYRRHLTKIISRCGPIAGHSGASPSTKQELVLRGVVFHPEDADLLAFTFKLK